MALRSQIEKECGSGATPWSLNPGGIHNARFNALNAAKDIAGESRRDVKLRAVAFKQRLAERRMRGAEGNCIDHRAIARTQARAHMIRADGLSECDLLLRESKYRFRISLSEGSCSLDSSQKVETHAAPGKRGVEDQRIVESGRLDGRFERLIEKGAKVFHPITRESYAGRHGMPPAFDRKAKINGAPHRRAKIDAT
jgi:hypothetical protein